MSEPKRVIHSFDVETGALVAAMTKILELASKSIERDLSRDKAHWDALDSLQKRFDLEIQKSEAQVQELDAEVESLKAQVKLLTSMFRPTGP